MPKRRRGEHVHYQEEFALQAKKLCKLGATDAQLADFFEVGLSTITNWRVVHKPFMTACKLGKSTADSTVERSLYQRAVGYSCEDTDIRVIEGKVVKTPTIKHYPPDTTACIYWTKNRDPQNWRDKREFDYRGNVPIAKIEIEVVDPEEKVRVGDASDQDPKKIPTTH